MRVADLDIGRLELCHCYNCVRLEMLGCGRFVASLSELAAAMRFSTAAFTLGGLIRHIVKDAAT
jgi:hypothetical protein